MSIIRNIAYFIAFIFVWIIATNIVISLEYSIYISQNILFDEVTFIDKILKKIDYFYLLINEYKNGDLFICFIYFVLMLTYFSTVISIFLKQNYYNKLLDFALNSAPMLGLLGTLYAFSTLVSGSNASDVTSLLSIFKTNFASAVTTTLLGGITYVLVLFFDLVKVKNEKH